jgi:hypothetical protein
MCLCSRLWFSRFSSWSASIALWYAELDQDIRFDNQLERLRPVNTYQITFNEVTQRFVNIFPFGVAILQLPFYLLGHLFLLNNWWNLNPDYFYQMQGVGLPYSIWIMLGANVMALGAIMIGWLMARRLTGNWTATMAAWALFVGTPLFYYSTVSPLNSHNPGALVTVCFIYLLMDCTGAFNKKSHSSKPATIKWLLLGLCGGMMILVRWQLLMVVVPALGLVAWQQKWRGLLYTLGMALIVSLPLPFIWQQMFGRPIVVPYEAIEGQSFIGVPRGAIWVLTQTPLHSPVLFLSAIGIYSLWRIDRAWATFAVLVIALQVLVNGSVLDPRGGDTYGVRRMTELYPVYLLMACAALGQLSHEKWHRYWYYGVRIALIVLILYSFLYILSFLSYSWTNTDGLFSAESGTMIRYFVNQGDRWQIMAKIFQTHLGPPAWPMPGP